MVAQPTTAYDTLARTLDQRVVILDGGMGTMLQDYRREEAGFRGSWFGDWPSDLKGNNDPLTRPDVDPLTTKAVAS